ncbi:hypothetical protein [Pseudomonas amygdali]|nr:hypothetical protein [Pseudomonas amygdali]KWT05405.1 hypothetical protein AL041_28105 [Pseudomonas amygdali pv. aesculi]KWT19481.1 hypothetical protein AL044_03485 [Pseudomonas amygdali pv. aesculi]KWT24540.1 hypothetical protein AL043_20500 [Pseudomonas amygdali pv. aesculi]KWT29324.1 hypothetical protein AL042_10670 [Pseudomonas amygdali pv. aesculi]KWT31761.1 hypothetical protein AMC94_05415 [Pseudomonas amygdali pv. aesculi]
MISDPFLEPESISTDALKKTPEIDIFIHLWLIFLCLLYFVIYKSITCRSSLAQSQMELVSISTPLAPALSGLGIRKSA